MSPRYLINEAGEPFSDQELEELTSALESLDQTQRKEFRNANAGAIAKHPAARILIVSGPGTGKSALFKQRILFWLEQNPDASILALSFVRKLIADLSNDIQNDKTLGDDQKSQVDVHTLHKYARSIVEQNHGTLDWRFKPHFQIITQTWKTVVWGDVLLLRNQENHGRYSWNEFEFQLHDDHFEESDEWNDLRETYFSLCQFYNAAGFSDLILRARDALAEHPGLNKHQLFIFDEYQDFNASEEALLEQLTGSSKGTLFAGDDDQVLYEGLKASKASLIRAIYSDTDVVNAMLPFCSRCDFHITRAADHFIKQTPDAECIKKIYEPISEVDASLKVQVIGCATPTTAVDYIRKFIEEHHEEVELRRTELAEGKEKDAFLMILSPSRGVDFYGPNAREELAALVDAFRGARREFSDDYYKVLNYRSLGNYSTNNFTFRKVLWYEGIDEREVSSLLKICLTEQIPFSAIDTTIVKDVLAKAIAVRDIVESEASIDEKVKAIAEHIQIANPALFQDDLEHQALVKEQIVSAEHQDEEQAELEEIEVKQMSAVELLTIVGSKGLSAEHVIIVGFDNVNMGWVTRNAFYVAMTRARKSLHIITALKAGGSKLPHDFLTQLPDANLEFSKYTKTKQTQVILGGRADLIRYLKDLATKSSPSGAQRAR
jgi:superfamily I DNA/RNA helicase